MGVLQRVGQHLHLHFHPRGMKMARLSLASHLLHLHLFQGSSNQYLIRIG